MTDNDKDCVEIVILEAGPTCNNRIYSDELRRKIAKQAQGKLVHVRLTSSVQSDGAVGVVQRSWVDEHGAVRADIVTAGPDPHALFSLVRRPGFRFTIGGRGKATRDADGRDVIDMSSYDLECIGGRWLREEACKGKKISIVFDGPPGSESGRFVEVEDEHGASVSVGEWRRGKNGYWHLDLCVVLPVVEDGAGTTKPVS